MLILFFIQHFFSSLGNTFNPNKSCHGTDNNCYEFMIQHWTCVSAADTMA